MIQPRNTLVVLDIIEKASQQVGKITVPTNGDLYTEAEVVAVGPGINRHESEVFDLKVGQRVFVKYKEHRGGPNVVPSLAGIKYIDNGKVYYIFEQSSIIGVLAQPGFEKPESAPLALPIRDGDSDRRLPGENR